MTLSGFLLARLDEAYIDCGVNAHVDSRTCECDFFAKRAWYAQRRIVRACSPRVEAPGDDPWGIDASGISLAYFVLTNMATVYRDHPDFQDEWRG